MRAWTRGQPVMTLDMPALILDIGAAERSIHKMADLFAGRPVRPRPHAKTHKASHPRAHAARGGCDQITSAKLGEAEVMAAAGVPAACSRTSGRSQRASRWSSCRTTIP